MDKEILKTTAARSLLPALALLAVLAVVLFVMQSDRLERPAPVFSEREMLEGIWHNYKQDFLEKETYRALDPERGGITTSEGQSYTMLRAVWIDDRETFDRAWQWTKDNLQRENDHLLSWLFGKRSDGTYGVLDQPGAINSASDGDTDTALALLLAYSRWRDDAYFGDAVTLLNDIWEHEVVEINGKRYLAANNVEKTANTQEVLLNPSYFAPYAYRIFGAVSPHPWEDLVDTSYEVIEESIALSEAEGSENGLPPDWVLIDRNTGKLRIPEEGSFSSNYSFDAVRVPWRLALDWKWFGEPRAEEALSKMSFLEEEWDRNRRLSAEYTNTGEPLTGDESPVMYGTSIGYFMVRAPEDARELYESKLVSLYSPDRFGWNVPLSYYANNWAWFGIALYTGLAENYTGIQ